MVFLTVIILQILNWVRSAISVHLDKISHISPPKIVAINTTDTTLTSTSIDTQEITTSLIEMVEIEEERTTATATVDDGKRIFQETTTSLNEMDEIEEERTTATATVDDGTVHFPS